jgi:Protein of unknown function (DUF3429)
MSANTAWARWLTFAGAIPLIAGSAAMWLAPNQYRSFAVNVLTVYAAVILSFLGGIQWGMAVSLIDSAPKSARNIFLLSVVPSLLAWGMLLLPEPRSRILVAIVLFAFVWVIDALLNVQKLIPQWFFKLRSTITVIVIACLAVAILKP